MEYVTLGRTGLRVSLRALGVDCIDLYRVHCPIAIVGSRRAAHVDDAVGALDLRLDRDDLAWIDAVLAHAVAVAGPSPEMV
jgi:aryl-alcohol dehydrogenase-like predicted oxidoreductase